jgi:hypothetical protein
MSHTVLLVFVAICWAVVAVDAMVHLAMGDLLMPAGMLGAFAVWLTLWNMHQSEEAEAPAKA